MRFYLFTGICVLLTLTSKAQHGDLYSQYMFNGLLVNPAYAGSNDALNVTALYRKQWVGFEGAPSNINLTAHSPLENKRVNLGLILSNDQFGISSHNKVNLVYAYRLPLGKGRLSFGLQGGVDFYQSDWSKVRTTDRSDPSFSNTNERKILPGAGAGVYYYTQRFFLGLSAPELLNSSQYSYKPFILFSGILIKASENFLVKPCVLVRYIKNSPVQTDASATFYWKDVIGLGVGYRFKDAGIAFLDLKINDQMRVGYAYDYTFNDLKNFSSGSHEIMLRYLFLYKVNAQSSRYF